ncbi:MULTISPECIES: hypothetical protein [unclassified Streptomyces]|uniref:hypothetical protein n=1 Tax=unclassified Streptomyces TaxID=2593676 RepID=UPI0037F2B1BD
MPATSRRTLLRGDRPRIDKLVTLRTTSPGTTAELPVSAETAAGLGLVVDAAGVHRAL